MTVRELINTLITFDVDEEILFYNAEEELLTVTDIGIDPSLPYIQFEKEGE